MWPQLWFRALQILAKSFTQMTAFLHFDSIRKDYDRDSKIIFVVHSTPSLLKFVHFLSLSLSLSLSSCIFLYVFSLLFPSLFFTQPNSLPPSSYSYLSISLSFVPIVAWFSFRLLFTARLLHLERKKERKNLQKCFQKFHPSHLSNTKKREEEEDDPILTISDRPISPIQSCFFWGGMGATPSMFTCKLNNLKTFCQYFWPSVFV